MAGELAEMIRDKREREGLSLRQAGEASGVAFSTLGRIEQGAEPSLRVDRQIRAWLNGEAPVLPTPPMTLRDWFAGQALTSMLSEPSKIGDGTPEIAARLSYRFADAMLTERANNAEGGA